MRARKVASAALWGPPLAWVLNVFFRVSILFFAIDSVINSTDDRYAGKGLPIRNVIIVVVWTMVFPALYRIGKKWKSYPVGYDNLYLSIFWLDMAGNYFDLYNVFGDWDTIPHIHGPGAMALIFRGLGRRSALASTGASTMIHAGLEVQEYLGDMVGGTHNVQGAGDTVHDIACGLIGAWLYVGCYALYFRMRKQPPPPDVTAPGRMVESTDATPASRPVNGKVAIPTNGSALSSRNGGSRSESLARIDPPPPAPPGSVPGRGSSG
jgi:hypothetical protein